LRGRTCQPTVHLTFWLNTPAPQITTTKKASKMPSGMITSMSSSLFKRVRVAAANQYCFGCPSLGWGEQEAGASIFRRARNNTLTPHAIPFTICLKLGVRPRRGCWASRLCRSFPSPTSFHLSRTRCGPSTRRRHPGGAAHHWGRRRYETLCFS